MTDQNSKPDSTSIQLRAAEADLILRGLEQLGSEDKQTVVYQKLHNQLKRTKEYWTVREKKRQMQLEAARKTTAQKTKP